MARKSINIVTTGGTIFQQEVAGRMEIGLTLHDLIARLELPVDVAIQSTELGRRSGAEIDFGTLLELREAIRAGRESNEGTIVLTGTDSMEELAFALDLMLEPGQPVIVTGAMQPADMLGYDGVANLADAITLALSAPARDLGVLLAIGQSIHPARYVRKHDSGLSGSFQSHPGPIAQMRLGEPYFYYLSLPPLSRYLAPCTDRLQNLSVMVWPMTVQPAFPEAMLDALDALVIAGMGTGSVAMSIIEKLQKWTAKLPIVLSSRCPVGHSYDDYAYRGSREKYESRGFRILGYETLNPYQARIKLMLELASSQAGR